MTTVWWALVVLLAVLAGWIVLVAFAGVGIRRPPAPRPNPTHSREEALARLAELQALDDATVADPCKTRLIEPNGASDVTIVMWHGFSNAPTQFAEVAERFAAAGHRVLLPRMPRHGLADVLNRDLLLLTEAELVEHVDACIDIAAGLGDEVWVMGLSAGGVLSAWAAAFRTEVRRMAMASPFVAPKGMPMPVVRLLIRFRRLIPKLYFWWDPRKKENLGESPYVYPGFPLPGMVPYLHLAQTLHDRREPLANHPRRVVFISNPGDFTIRADVARRLTFHTFDGATSYVAEVAIDASRGWWHDFVDPWGPHVGTSDEAAAVFLSALGISSDPSALGTLAPPYPTFDPIERDDEVA